MNDPVALVTTWVDLVSDLTVAYPDADLKQGLAKLAARADAQFPQLASGGRVALTLDDLDGCLEGTMPETVQMGFVLTTGDVLFTGIDGPNVTALWMRQTLERVEART
jgi:hypothetical protein